MQALSDVLDTTGLFYYVTMKDYERREVRRKPKAKLVRRVNPFEKNRLVSNRENDYALMFDFKKLKKLKGEITRIDSYEDLFSYLSLLPIGECMIPTTPLNTYFTCRFIYGNYAWISQNKNGHYRYFSKKKDGETVSFDLLDLIEIVFGLSSMEAVEKAVDLLSIRFMEDVWKKDQKEKYLRNYQFIHSDARSDYPTLFEYIDGCLPLIEAMNALGTLHIHKKEYAYKGHNLFFASSSYISQFVGFYTSSKVVKLINLFAVLGLIEKAPVEDLHPVLRKESAKIAELRSLGNMISYYIVNSFELIAPIAEERAKNLKRNGIRYSNLSKAVVLKVFGAEFAETIYVQTIQKNKKKTERKSTTIQKSLETNFEKILNEHNFVTKSMILDCPIGELTEKQKKHHLNQIWSFLIEMNQCEYIKPTTAMKEMMGLKSSEYIALRKNKES